MSWLDQHSPSPLMGERWGEGGSASLNKVASPPSTGAPSVRLASPSRGEVMGALRLLAVGVITLSLSACLQPLYGPTASGVPVQEAFASIQIEPVSSPPGQDRITHFLRSELVFDLDGSGQPRPKRYKLNITVAQTVVAPIVDSISGRAQSAMLNATAAYTLSTLDGTRTLTTGIASATASYDRHQQRFASVRAARDAEMRVAKLLSEQIRMRLAPVLLSGS